MKKLFIVFAVALFALFFASCSSNGDDPTPSTSSNSQGNGDAAGCFETSGQLIDEKTGQPYTGGGKVYIAEKFSNGGNLILTEEDMIFIGTMNDGIITFNCPENVDSRFLMEVKAAPGVEVEPLGVEALLYTEAFRLIGSNGEHIGNIRYKKQNDPEFYTITYGYFSEEVKINGEYHSEHGDGYKLEMDAKKGWNKIYALITDLGDEYYSVFETTDLGKAPDGLEWTIYLY